MVGMIILKGMKFSCLSIACQVPHAVLICQTLSLSNASIEKQRPWRVADILRYGVSALLVSFRVNHDNEPLAHPTPGGEPGMAVCKGIQLQGHDEVSMLHLGCAAPLHHIFQSGSSHI